jgi:hypothetical protein
VAKNPAEEIKMEKDAKNADNKPLKGNLKSKMKKSKLSSLLTHENKSNAKSNLNPNQVINNIPEKDKEENFYYNHFSEKSNRSKSRSHSQANCSAVDPNEENEEKIKEEISLKIKLESMAEGLVSSRANLLNQNINNSITSKKITQVVPPNSKKIIPNHPHLDNLHKGNLNDHEQIEKIKMLRSLIKSSNNKVPENDYAGNKRNRDPGQILKQLSQSQIIKGSNPLSNSHIKTIPLGSSIVKVEEETNKFYSSLKKTNK